MKRLLVLTPIAALAACTMMPSPGPGPGPYPTTLANSNWRVVAVNGRPAPANPSVFFMNFAPATFSAKFGCNGMGADYIQRGAIVDAGPVIGTRMACPDMSYEIEAGRVLDPPMLATWNGPSSLRLSSPGGTMDLRR